MGYRLGNPQKAKGSAELELVSCRIANHHVGWDGEARPIGGVFRGVLLPKSVGIRLVRPPADTMWRMIDVVGSLDEALLLTFLCLRQRIQVLLIVCQGEKAIHHS